MTPTPTTEDGKATLIGGRNWRQRLQLFAIVAVLATPSLWMFASVPPLWRDHDAYNQLTRNPARTTENGHGALYSVAVRVPLMLGYQFERLTSRIEPARGKFLVEPPLTDTGISLLLVAQHAGLWAAALALITTAARPWPLRIALAVLFASNPIFYTFAHCTGSESLSQILLLVVATFGLRIVTSETKPARRLWWSFGVALCAAMLTRHANMLLAFVLPIALLVPTSKRPFARAWRLSLLALLVGVTSIGMARLGTTALCAAGGRKYYPRVGFTFQWRLPFLNDLPAPARTEVLGRAAANARTEDARQVIALLGRMLQENVPLEKGTVMPRSRAMLLETGPEKGVVPRHHFALNEMARAFLTPPSRELLRVANSDFARARRMNVAETARSLFGTTLFYFDHRAELALLAPLRTYRDYTPESLSQIQAESWYLRSLGTMTLNQGLLVWLVISAVALALGWRVRSERPVQVCAWGAALLLAALSMIAATCLVGELLPRYTLPLWVLLWAALIMTIGEIGKSAGRLESQVKLPGGLSSLPPESASSRGSTPAAS